MASTAQVTDKDSGAIATADDDAEIAQYITGFALYIVAAVITMVGFLLMLDSTVLATAIPSITSHFNSLKDIGWYGSAYLMTICALQLLWGKIYQFYSSKFTFIGALIVFELGSVICGVSTSSAMFIIGRAVAGCGGAGISNGALTIISASAPQEKRPVLLGILIGFSSIGLVFGPLIGGTLTQHLSWRWCFYINFPIGAVTIIVLAIMRIPDAKVTVETKPSIKAQIHRLDLPGSAIFAPAIVMLLLALDWGGVSYPWNSAKIIGLFCGFAGTFCLFLCWESHRGETAMLPLSLFRNSIVSSAAMANMMSSGAYFSVAYYLPVWFQVVEDVSPVTSGIYSLPSVISQVVGSVSSGFLVSKIGYYTPFIIIGSAMAAVGSGLMSTFTPSTTNAARVCYQLLYGFARGMILQQPVTAIQANVPKHQMAIGTALIGVTQNFGAALFISLAQTIFANSLRSALATFAPEVDANKVISVGATSFRTVVSESSVPKVILAYNKALTATFYLSVGACCLTFATAWGMGWTNLKKTKKRSDVV